MGNRLFVLILFVAISVVDSYGQRQLCGYVRDASSGEVLIGALAQIEGISNYSVANDRGYLCINLGNELDSIEISYIGYFSRKFAPTAFENEENNIFYLHVADFLLEEIVVGAKSNFERTLAGHVTLDVEKIKSIPSLAGEADLMKAITIIPGITGGREGYSNLHVRGGGRDQNLVLLDGNVIYNNNHMGGFVSMFNPEVLKNVSIYKAGFPARFGDRLSSVIDVRTRSGNMNQFNGNLKLGLISTSLLLEGPVFKNKSSFILGFRRSYFNIVNFTRNFNYLRYGVGYLSIQNFHDINFKYTHLIGKKSTLELVFYNGNDNFTYKEKRPSFGVEGEDKSLESNNSASLIYTMELGQNLFLTSSLGMTAYNYSLADLSKIEHGHGSERIRETTMEEWRSKTKEYRWRSRLDYWVGGHNIKSGFEISTLSYGFDFGGMNNKLRLQDSILVDNNTVSHPSRSDRGNQLALFVEDEFGVGKNISLNIGLRYVVYKAFRDENKYQSFEPRVSTRWALNDLNALKFSYMYAQQYSFAMVQSIDGFEIVKWVGANSRIPPQQVHQVSLGYFAQLPRMSTELSLEGYYKKMDNLIESNLPLTYFPDYSKWEELIFTGGKGATYGLEFSLERNTKKLKTNLSYSLGWANRQFDQINNGQKYPFTYDRRHVLDALVVFPLPSRRFDISIFWTYQSGHAFSIPTGYVPDSPFNPGYYAYDGVNNGRLPDYHRLDIAIHRRWQTKGKRSMNFTLNVYNVYNRANALFLYVDHNNEVKQIAQFPLFPSFSLGVGLIKSK